MRKTKGTSAEDDDILLERTGASDESDAAPIIRKLKKELAACSKERREYLEGWQRTKADAINSKKATVEERAQYVQFAAEGVLSSLIPVLDSFDMAFENSVDKEVTDENWWQGIKHIHSQLLRTLEEHGIAVIDPQGELFDPEQHESVGEVLATEDCPSQTIATVRQKGYRLGTKVLRAAKVEMAA